MSPSPAPCATTRPTTHPEPGLANDDILTPADLRALLIEVIAGATETDPADWQHAVGAVEKTNLVFDARTNWAVVAQGSPSTKTKRSTSPANWHGAPLRSP